MTRSLEGRAALITGASQGLGLAIARAYAAAGASVMLCARDADLLERARDEVAALAGPDQVVLAHAADVSRPEQAGALSAAALNALPELQILVNNAGVYGPIGLIEEADWDAWVRAIEINLFGSILMCRALLPHFKARRYGKIIQLSGGGATNPLPRLTAYAASKAAVVRFAESLALEVKDQGIDVNALAPGALNTRLMDELIAAGPARVGDAFFERMKRIAEEGGTPLETGGGAGGVSRIGGERWHHRKAPQRGVGSVARAAGPSRGARRDRRLHPASCDAGGPRAGLGSEMSPGVAIVGCGSIGRKRAAALGEARLVACADLDRARAESLARTAAGAAAVDDWRSAVGRADVDIVAVATTNEMLAEIAHAALEAGKHVMVEKPAARSVAEIDPVIAAARRAGRLVRVGFNHRYHPALRKARELFDAGVLGDLMFVRGRYGHGGRVGYDKEWRADPVRSGGGELIDQGVHLIDLSRWFLGEFTVVDGLAHTYFWQMPVDDNAFLLLRTAGDRMAFLHVSCTEWKNLFSLEIYGTLRQAAHRGPGRQLRSGTAGVLPDAARDGTARDDHLGVPARRSVVGAGIRGVPRRHQARQRALGRTHRRPRRAGRRR